MTSTLSSRALRGPTAAALVCAALSGCGGGDGAETADTYTQSSGTGNVVMPEE